LLLVRHGETEGNVQRRLQGTEDPLTERGRRQARELAVHLSGRDDVSALYASPYPRAFETARAIGAELGLEPVPRAGLAEMDVGRAAGYSFEEWAEKFPEEAASFREEGVGYAWPDGESGLQLAERTAAELDRILEDHRREKGAVVVVSHGGALAWIISRLLGEPGDRWPGDHFDLDNCSVTEVEVRADRDGPAEFLYKNEIGHLSPDPDAEVATGDEHPG
jgi:broad specificity phosphatase PhoE